MAVRTDFTYDFTTSPRVITIEVPSLTVSIQDLHDTLATEEARPGSMSFPQLISSSGKALLGGGLFVGITAELQNAKLAFAARGGPSFVQCTITGGNLVSVDAVDAFLDPIQTTAFTQVVLTNSTSAALLEEFTSAEKTALLADVALIKDIEQGRWQIVSNQMIIFESDGLTPLLTFNLLDAAGNPTVTNIVERVPVP